MVFEVVDMMVLMKSCGVEYDQVGKLDLYLGENFLSLRQHCYLTRQEALRMHNERSCRRTMLRVQKRLQEATHTINATKS